MDYKAANNGPLNFLQSVLRLKRRGEKRRRWNESCAMKLTGNRNPLPNGCTAIVASASANLLVK